MMKDLKNLHKKIMGEWYPILVLGLLIAILVFTVRCNKNDIENLTQARYAIFNPTSSGVEDVTPKDAVQVTPAQKVAIKKLTAAAKKAISDKAKQGNVTAFPYTDGVGAGKSNLWPLTQGPILDGPNGDYQAGVEQRLINASKFGPGPKGYSVPDGGPAEFNTNSDVYGIVYDF